MRGWSAKEKANLNMNEEDALLNELDDVLQRSKPPEKDVPAAERQSIEKRMIESGAWIEDTLRGLEQRALYPRAPRSLPRAVSPWVQEAVGGTYGIDVAFFCVIAQRFGLPIPTPDTFTPFEVVAGSAPPREVLVVPYKILVEDFDVSVAEQITKMSDSQLEEVAAHMLYAAHLHQDEVYLQACARILATIPTVCVRLLTTDFTTTLNKTPPAWFILRIPYCRFLLIAGEILARSDWRYHRHLLLSAELNHLQGMLV